MGEHTKKQQQDGIHLSKAEEMTQENDDDLEEEATVLEESHYWPHSPPPLRCTVRFPSSWTLSQSMREHVGVIGPYLQIPTHHPS